MLEKVILSTDRLADGPQKIRSIFNKNFLLARVIRSLRDLLTNEKIAEVRRDLAEELKAYDTGINTKHSGGHFATTLILPGKPIQLFNAGVGLLHNCSGLNFKALCLSDAQDDNGFLDEKLIKTTPSYKEFVAEVQATEPNFKGYCHYNEAQFHLKKASLLGIFASINAISGSEYEQKLDNIAAYLNALAINNFLFKEFGLDLLLCLYDAKQGELMFATRNPDIKTLLLYLTVLNQESYSCLGLDTTDKNELIAINRRILTSLNMHITEVQFNRLIENSLQASIDAERKNTLESVNSAIEDSFFPPEFFRLRYSKSENCYELMIFFQALSSTNKIRVKEMMKFLKLEAINKSHKVHDIPCLGINFANEKEALEVSRYFYNEEDEALSQKAEAETNNTASVTL